MESARRTAPQSVGGARPAEADYLTDTHVGLVRKEARRWSWALCVGMEMGDLVNAGHVGVEVAKAKFDPSRGFKFSTYALWWVKHFMRRASERARVVYVPAETRKAAHAAGEAFPFASHSLDDELCPGDAHPVTQAEDVEGNIDAARAASGLLDALHVLPKRHLEVVTLFHYRGLTFGQIAEHFAISTSRARAIYKESLDRLRHEML